MIRCVPNRQVGSMITEDVEFTSVSNIPIIDNVRIVGPYERANVRAVDGLFWLRQEFENASDGEKFRLARQLHNRANSAGDKLEAIRWTEFLAERLVASLTSKLLLRTDVEERLRHDASLGIDVRAAALLRAAELVEDADEAERGKLAGRSPSERRKGGVSASTPLGRGRCEGRARGCGLREHAWGCSVS